MSDHDALSGHDAMLAQVATQVGPFTAEMVACGIVVSCWRDAIEPLHHRLADHEMAYINIGTTIAVAAACSSSTVDWPAVWVTLRNPDRLVLPGRTVKQLAGRDWKHFKAAVTWRLQDCEHRPTLAHAAWATMACRNWWGMPAYPAVVAALVASGKVTRWSGSDAELAAALLHDPLAVPLEVWKQIVGGNGYGWLDTQDHLS